VHYTNAAGCDSVHTLNLTINNSTTGTSSATACDTYTWNGVAYTASGVYTNTNTNAAGCDSVHTLNLTINNSTTSTSSATSCDSYSWNGTVYTSSGTYTYTTINSAGCDSTATLILTINNSNTGSSSVTSCDSYTWDGQGYTASGAYTNTYINSAGCDSVHTLNLTINNSTSSVDSIIACDSYTWVNGIIYTASNNTATYMFQTVAGCDSLTTLDLTINSSIIVDIKDTICDGDTIFVGNSFYTGAGSYSDIFQAINGCDSIINTDLSIYPKPQANKIIGNDTVNVNSVHTYFVDPKEPSSTYNWGIIGNATIVNGQGTDEIDIEWDTLNNQIIFVIETTADSCIGDTIFFNVYVNSEPLSIYESNTTDLIVYPNPTHGHVTVSFNSNKTDDYKIRIINMLGEKVFVEKLWDFKGFYEKDIDLTNNSKGIYFLEIEKDDGVINKKLILQ